MSSKSDSRMIALGIGRFSLLLLKIRASSPELWILRHAQALSPTTELVGVDRPAVSYPFGSIEHLLLDLRAPVQEIEDPGGGHALVLFSQSSSCSREIRQEIASLFSHRT